VVLGAESEQLIRRVDQVRTDWELGECAAALITVPSGQDGCATAVQSALSHAAAGCARIFVIGEVLRQVEACARQIRPGCAPGCVVTVVHSPVQGSYEEHVDGLLQVLMTRLKSSEIRAVLIEGTSSRLAEIVQSVCKTQH
jgi:hypothetical protein